MLPTIIKFACSGSSLFCFLIAFETNQNQGYLFRIYTISFLIAFETIQNQCGLFRIFTILFSYCIWNKPEPTLLVQDLHYFVFLLHLKQTRTKVTCSGSSLFCFLIAFETIHTKVACSGSSLLCFLIAFETIQNQSCLFRIFTILFSYCSWNNPYQGGFFRFLTTVKTLYNVTRYNRIFNIRQKLLGTDLFPLKFPL